MKTPPYTRISEEDDEDPTQITFDLDRLKKVPRNSWEDCREGLNWGMIGGLLFCFLFWGSMAWLFFHK